VEAAGLEAEAVAAKSRMVPHRMLSFPQVGGRSAQLCAAGAQKTCTNLYHSSLCITAPRVSTIGRETRMPARGRAR
jgi:hypothetical protein